MAVCPPAMAGNMRDAGDLLRVGRIHVQGFDDHWSRFFNPVGIADADTPLHYTVDPTLAALEIVAAGGGVAVVVRALSETARQRGLVVQAIDHRLDLATAHYLIEQPGDQVRRREVEQFRAWLLALAATT